MSVPSAAEEEVAAQRGMGPEQVTQQFLQLDPQVRALEAPVRKVPGTHWLVLDEKCRIHWF